MTGKLILIDDARKDRDLTVAETWDAYVAARELADRTKKIEDGIAASKAWRAWVELFDRRRA